jgi:hypothetical protein
MLTSSIGSIPSINKVYKVDTCLNGAHQPADEEPGGRAAEVVGRDEARLEQVLQGEGRLPGGGQVVVQDLLKRSAFNSSTLWLVCSDTEGASEWGASNGEKVHTRRSSRVAWKQKKS